MKISAVIIDDERGSRETLEKMIDLFCPEIEIISQADSVKGGYEIITLYKPSLVFLDIRMQDGTGFDLLRGFEKIDFKIIFVTAYDEYAFNAFKFSAIDYILKPLEKDSLISAIQKAKEAIENNVLNLKIRNLLHNIEKENKKLSLKTSDSFHIIPVNEIVRCEAQGNYTVFYLVSGEKILISTTLKEYEEMLGNYQFFRIHHSHLINLNLIAKFEKKDGGIIIMKDKSIVPVATRKKDRLMELLEKI